MTLFTCPDCDIVIKAAADCRRCPHCDAELPPAASLESRFERLLREPGEPSKSTQPGPAASGTSGSAADHP